MHQFWLLQTKFIRAFVRNNDLFSTLVIISNSNQNGHKSFICGTLFPLWKKKCSKSKKKNEHETREEFYLVLNSKIPWSKSRLVFLNFSFHFSACDTEPMALAAESLYLSYTYKLWALVHAHFLPCSSFVEIYIYWAFRFM